MAQVSGSRTSSKRSSSKLKTLSTDDRMILQLPRLGLAPEEQLEYLDHLYPQGGHKAIQALLNLMGSGVVDGVIWSRESWVGDSIGSVTGFDGDKLDLMDPVAMPPTGGCNLMYTEGVLESMLNQLQVSVAKVTNAIAGSSTFIGTLATEAPRQVCMLVQRLRFTSDVHRCLRESRQLSTISRAHLDIRKKLAERLMNKDIPEGERAALMSVVQVMHEQQNVLQALNATKGPEEAEKLWKEQARFYHDEKEQTIELKAGDKVVSVGHEYNPPTMLITTEFTHTLRWAYLNTMCEEGSSRLLVLIGIPGCGKTAMLHNVGQLLGTMPTTIRITEKCSTSRSWWLRRFKAAKATGGGKLAPVILTQAHRGEACLEVALSVANDIGVALCLTMSPSPETTRLTKGLLAGSTMINVPESELKVIAAGQLGAEGLSSCEVLAEPLSKVLETLRQECTPQPHYDFGPRTLMQLCSQSGVDRRPHTEERETVAMVLERCLLPKLVKADVPVLQRLLKENFKVDRTLIAPTDAEEGRFHKVAMNIRTITKIEPDCIVLPVPASDEEAFFEEFCKMLNRHGSALVKMPGKLSDMTPEQLLGKMPSRKPDGSFEKLDDGVLVSVLRKAMAENSDPDQLVWISMMTGNVTVDVWESLHELLNDSRCINLASGEQLRLSMNLRFLFIMPDAGTTPQDTFSRAAVVYTDPPSSGYPS